MAARVNHEKTNKKLVKTPVDTSFDYSDVVLIKNKYNKKCNVCRGKIKVGALMFWNKETSYSMHYYGDCKNV